MVADNEPEEIGRKPAYEVLGTGKPGSSFLPEILQMKDGEPRQWLIDRVDGSERFMDPDSAPCCPCFNAPKYSSRALYTFQGETHKPLEKGINIYNGTSSEGKQTYSGDSDFGLS